MKRKTSLPGSPTFQLEPDLLVVNERGRRIIMDNDKYWNVSNRFQNETISKVNITDSRVRAEHVERLKKSKT